MCLFIYNFKIEPATNIFVAPKISGGRLQELTIRKKNHASMLCLGQSYPTPNFRYISIIILLGEFYWGFFDLVSLVV